MGRRGLGWLGMALVLVWGLPVLACGGSAQPTATPTKTPVVIEPVVAEPTATPMPPTAASVVVAPLPTDTPILPTATSVPLSLEDQVRQSIGNESNRGIAERVRVETVADVVVVNWAIDDNLSKEWIVAGAWRDIAQMMRAIRESGIDYSLIRFEGTFSMVDNFGNSSEMPVLIVSISQETVNKVNWADEEWVKLILYQKLPDIADAVQLHPALQE
ncbi:MAG TPA: hypothetical protein PL105_03210 [Caldilineaceae bacterium]|nr:hypothetical protein [Caldilineaceae bacterium]